MNFFTNILIDLDDLVPTLLILYSAVQYITQKYSTSALIDDVIFETCKWCHVTIITCIRFMKLYKPTSLDHRTKLFVLLSFKLTKQYNYDLAVRILDTDANNYV